MYHGTGQTPIKMNDIDLDLQCYLVLLLMSAPSYITLSAQLLWKESVHIHQIYTYSGQDNMKNIYLPCGHVKLKFTCPHLNPTSLHYLSIASISIFHMLIGHLHAHLKNLHAPDVREAISSHPDNMYHSGGDRPLLEMNDIGKNLD